MKFQIFFTKKYNEESSDKLSEFNSELIISICDFVGIQCDFLNSSELGNFQSAKGTNKIFVL